MKSRVPLTPAQKQAQEAIIARAKLKMLSRRIRDSKHLAQILRDADPCHRKAVYEEITPHLRFKAKPFFLMKF